MTAADTQGHRPGVVRVGCAMWAHPGWAGRYVRAGHELEDYATWCTAVEGNTTFYALPAEHTVARWAELAPAAFRFVFKLPRDITHDRRLRGADGELTAFLARIEPLGERLGPLTVQLPSSFSPPDLPVLLEFLDRMPAGVERAVEVRHPGFYDDGPNARSLNAALADRGANRVMLDARALFDGPCETPGERDAFRAKPRLPVRAVATGATPVVRFIGRTDPESNPPYWRRWCNKVAEWVGEGRQPYVFCHTPDNLVAPDQARRFHAEVATLVPLEPLPDPVDVIDEPTLW